jgi:hypothetical protein
MDAPVHQVQVRPVERLEFAAAKSGSERKGKERAFPVIALGKKSLEFRIGVGDVVACETWAGAEPF